MQMADEIGFNQLELPLHPALVVLMVRDFVATRMSLGTSRKLGTDFSSSMVNKSISWNFS